MSATFNRSDLLKRMLSKGTKGVVTKVIPFRNDDVPRFLKRLDAFEKASRRSCLTVGQERRI